MTVLIESSHVLRCYTALQVSYISFSRPLWYVYFLKKRWKFRACDMGFLPELYEEMPRLFSRTSRHRFRITSSLFASVHLEINMYSLSFLANRSKSNDPGSIASCTTRKGWMAKMFAGTTPSINDAWGNENKGEAFSGRSNNFESMK